MTHTKHVPHNPNLRQLRNQAKDLHHAYRAGQPNAIRRIGEFHPRFSGSSQAEIAATEIVLADAQLVIARELGFDSWPKLKSHIESLSSPPLSTHELVTVSTAEQAIAEIEKLGGRCEIDENGQVRTVSLIGGCLSGLVGLRKLDLRVTQVTDVGANELRKALPNCRIYR